MMCRICCLFLGRRFTLATNLDLDDKLIEAARKLGGHKTKREAVTRALQEYVDWLRQQAIMSEFGKIDYDPKYDYKKQRKVA
jgi:Arc/MetJ family transcription regulator